MIQIHPLGVDDADNMTLRHINAFIRHIYVLLMLLLLLRLHLPVIDRSDIRSAQLAYQYSSFILS